MQNFRALGTPPPDPPNSFLPLTISGYVPDDARYIVNLWVNINRKKILVDN